MGAAGFTPGFHPLVVGGSGEGGSEAAGTLIAEADVVLRIGATWWPGEWLSGSARVVAIDVLAANIGAGVSPAFGVVGDAQAVLEQFLGLMWPISRPQWISRVTEVKKDWEARIEAEVQESVTGIAPARLMRALEKVVPENAIIALDTGEHTVWFNRIFRGKGQDVLISGVWRTMGFGLPAAAAAKVAYPDRPVVAVVGDGGLGMVLADFISLVKHRLPVVIVVVNNGSLALELHTMQQGGLYPAGALLQNPDFAGVANLCGGNGLRVSEADKIEEVLGQAIYTDKPTLVEVSVANIMIPTVPARAAGVDARPKP
jgi:pyruvate dehydrogenase (quinone)/pyruvate oxidase